MPFNHFIQQANYYGKNRTPFFFLIDFERQKPFICPLEQLENGQILFNIQGNTNCRFNNKTFTAPSVSARRAVAFADYEKGFNLVREELQKGNSYLLNLTYPTEIELNGDLQAVFHCTEAKYKLLFHNEFICFSPETFVRIQQNKIFTYPMKGTINAALENAEQQLLDSQKEQREHYTIVDLMRNDLAIVAKNIRVTRFRYVETIHTENGAILQTSSEICGDLETNWQEGIGSILADLLPAGSISGAPKEKTVEIIQRAEQQARGYYTGVFGIFNGENLDSAVAIRFIERQGDKLFFRSGGGITVQSDVHQEYQELIEKVYIPDGKQR
ncbi:aminodeoxychorismate synthase component I [Caviibacterium pharyngocola]|uniref:Aminodeoxychorismate synthase component I n=1 Tax=Caviibacterium pharyngocola TaxID=28159 RepID=A0A2M8RYD3_9PAST|nr:aminodeoxychorismate synthase component I [Caviibacterium pharyngocola]PJG83884.1 aminodeoxychorismate synthase component I [Caviibacterium pharyngocola]